MKSDLFSLQFYIIHTFPFFFFLQCWGKECTISMVHMLRSHHIMCSRLGKTVHVSLIVVILCQGCWEYATATPSPTWWEVLPYCKVSWTTRRTAENPPSHPSHINANTVNSAHLNGAAQLSSCVNNPVMYSAYMCCVHTGFGHIGYSGIQERSH